MSWNIHGRARPNLAQVAQEIVDFSPDAVGLQEVSVRQIRELSRLTKMNFVWDMKHNPLAPFVPTSAEGLAIMSPHQLTNHRSQVLTKKARKRSHKRRIIQSILMTTRTQPVLIFNTHLASHDAAKERLCQAERVRSFIDEHNDGLWLLTGDLNDHEEPEIVECICRDQCIDAWQSDPTGTGTGATCPSIHPELLLDHILLPTAATYVQTRIPSPTSRLKELSDHLPIMATASLPLTITMGIQT